jgi:hypothetical protein
MTSGVRAARFAVAAAIVLFSACTTSQHPIEAQVGPKEPVDTRLAGRWSLARDERIVVTIEPNGDELALHLRDPDQPDTEKYRVRIARVGRFSYASATRAGSPEAWTLYRFRVLDGDSIVVNTVDDAFMFRAVRGASIRGIPMRGPPARAMLTAPPRELREFVRRNPDMFAGEQFELRREP